MSVLIDTRKPTLKAVIINGKAELKYGDVIPKRISIFEKYLGAKECSRPCQQAGKQLDTGHYSR